MGVVEKLAAEQKLPRMVRVKQHFDCGHIEIDDFPDLVDKQLNRAEITEKIRPDMSVAVTCGSRGIANIRYIIKAIVNFLHNRGARPFVVPAMGSHGGATSAGQIGVLANLGVTEEFLGCPIQSSMETLIIGQTPEGHEVHLDKNAAQADGIFVANRIKPHTSFTGPYESGLMKMLAIGLGKQQGAEVIHESGFGHAAHMIPMFANTILAHANIVGGLAILENAFDQTRRLVGLSASEIPEKEPELLKDAYTSMGRIYLGESDVLVIDKIGKNMSGDGMDPNISGTFATPYRSGNFHAERVVVLDLTEETHGNFNGLGMADLTTRRTFNKLKLDETYPNAITSTILENVKIPMVCSSDKAAIQLAVKVCNGIDKTNPRIIRIPNTMDITEIEISEALLPAAKANPNMEVQGELYELPFDENGNLF